MEAISEIYLTKKKVSKEEWLELIKVISRFNGFFYKWQIIMQNDKNGIRYFVKTRCSLPPTINNLNSFLLKSCDNITLPSSNITYPFLAEIGSNFIDIINYLEIKNKGTLEYVQITFQKLYEDKIKTKTNIYIKQNDYLKKYKLILGLPTCLLAIDFEGNKRYFYKNAPKYLDINKILNLLNTDTNLALLKVDTFPYLQGDFYLKQSSFDFAKHSVIMGSSGTGKSKFISLLINNIYQNSDLRLNYKVVVIDPHASLENDIGGISKVIDFKNSLDSIDLFINDNDDIISSTELLIELFKSLIAEQYNAKLERVLRHSVYLLLTCKSFNFSNLRRVLLDIEYRNYLINNYKNVLPVSVVDFFLSDFNEIKTKSYSEAISPIIAFIDEMEMLPVFNNQETNENLQNTIINNFSTLFSLDRTKLGDKVTKTIAGLVMGQLFTLVQKREIIEHIIFIVDEVAVVENPFLTRFLSEARKYNLSIIFAGQFFSQITDELKNAIFANVINYYIFRISKLDANILVDNFNMKIPLDDSRERKIKLLTELNDRQCIARINVRGTLLPAFKGTTLDFTSIPRASYSPQGKTHENNPSPFKEKSNFQIGSNVNLKDILKANSTSRKVVK